MRVVLFVLLLGAIAVVGVAMFARVAEMDVAKAAADEGDVADAFDACCRHAAETGVDVLLWIRPNAPNMFTRGDPYAFERELLTAETAPHGFEVFVWEGIADQDPAFLPDALQPLVWWMPLWSSGGSSKRDPSPMSVSFNRLGTPPFLLLDALGRAVGAVGDYRAGGSHTFLASVRKLRADRERRDAAFARARAVSGTARAAELQAGLMVLDDWTVLRCYADELAEIVATGDDDARAWAEPRLHQSRVQRGCDAVGRAVAADYDTLDSRQMRARFAAVTAKWQDVPEILQLAACCQASVDLRTANDPVARAAIAADLEDAVLFAPGTWVGAMALQMLHDLRR